MKQVIRYPQHGFKLAGTGRHVRGGWAYGEVATLEEVSTHETPVLAADIYDQVATPAGALDAAEVFPGASPDLTAEKPLPAARSVIPTADAPVTRGLHVGRPRHAQAGNPLAAVQGMFTTPDGRVDWRKIGIAAALVALFNAVTR